jgi:uncharacterized membrane protein
MFWRKKGSQASGRKIAFRAFFAGACLSAFAIYGYGVRTGTVLELISLLFLVVLALLIPAAVMVGIIKLVGYALKRLKSEEP